VRRARSYYTIEFDTCCGVCTRGMTRGPHCHWSPTPERERTARATVLTSVVRRTGSVCECVRVRRVRNVALILNIVIPSIYMRLSCVPCRAAGAVCRRASARLAAALPGCAVRARRTPRVATSTAHTEPPPALSFRFTLGSISRHLGHCRVIGHVGRAGTTPLKKPGQSDVVVSWCGAAVGAATEKETATLCALP
jgi:hypothetical protein